MTMPKPFRGRVLKYGDHIDTDIIISAEHCTTLDEKELGSYCFGGYDDDFQTKKQAGDFIVAGVNFGCGSSREMAPLSIRGAGIAGVIAASFARIFYRNAINIGLPIWESKEAYEKIDEGDELEIVPDQGVIRNLTRNEDYQTRPLPDFILEVVRVGGMREYVRQQLKSKEQA